MGLEDRAELGTQTMQARTGAGFYVGLTEPNGGEVVIGIELPPDFRDDTGHPLGPGHYVIVTCGSVRARDISSALTELADVVDAA